MTAEYIAQPPSWWDRFKKKLGLQTSPEYLVKRSVYVAACECGERTVSYESVRERFCACGKWVPFVEESYVGPDTFGKDKQ
jgi:hypothetical protein